MNTQGERNIFSSLTKAVIYILIYFKWHYFVTNSFPYFPAYVHLKKWTFLQLAGAVISVNLCVMCKYPPDTGLIQQFFSFMPKKCAAAAPLHKRQCV